MLTSHLTPPAEGLPIKAIGGLTCEQKQVVQEVVGESKWDTTKQKRVGSHCSSVDRRVFRDLLDDVVNVGTEWIWELLQSREISVDRESIYRTHCVDGVFSPGNVGLDELSCVNVTPCNCLLSIVFFPPKDVYYTACDQNMSLPPDAEVVFLPGHYLEQHSPTKRTHFCLDASRPRRNTFLVINLCIRPEPQFLYYSGLL